MSVPQKYLTGLSKKDKEEKKKNIKQTKELLKKGKKKEAIEKAKQRPIDKKNKRESSFTIRFKKKFGDIKVESKEFERKTGIPVSIQKQVIRRGMGAYLSSGSRATVSSPRQWGIARLYSFYFNKGKTFDKDLGEKVKFK
tara:strand:- start:2126 stop:2545 length:420 start_codon:yes stop_codon:yes gene_type:complete